MGCWNKTCAITKLPIYSGERTVLYFIIQHGFTLDSLPCDHNAYWEAIAIPFYGEYDDYGFQKMDDGQQWKLKILTDLFEKSSYLADDSVNGRTVTYVPQPEAFHSFENLHEAIRGRLCVDNPYNRDNKLLISHIMMHEKSYHDLISNKSDDVKIMKIFDEQVLSIKNNNVDNKAEWNFMFALDKDLEYNNPARRFINFMNIGHAYGVQYPNTTILTDYKYAIFNNSDAPEKFMALEFYNLFEAFRLMRFQITPQPGEGSQDRENEYHDKFLKIYGDRLHQLKHMYDED